MGSALTNAAHVKLINAEPGVRVISAREQEIVTLMREGLASKTIAARLFISTHTVKTHIRHAMEKTGLPTRVLLAMRIPEKH